MDWISTDIGLRNKLRSIDTRYPFEEKCKGSKTVCKFIGSLVCYSTHTSELKTPQNTELDPSPPSHDGVVTVPFAHFFRFDVHSIKILLFIEGNVRGV